MTGHNLILRNASPPIADAPPSHVRAVRAGGRATNNTRHAPMQTEQCQPGRICQRPGSPKASRSPSPSPRIHERHRPSRRSARGAFIRKARGIGRRTRKIGKPNMSPPAKRDGQKCEKLQKVPCQRQVAGDDRLLRTVRYWNHQIFCVNWRCFISPQGGHASCNGKIVRQPHGGSSRRRHEGGDMSTYRFLGAALFCAAVLAPSALGAQTYPSKPIHFILPYVPGGIIDTAAAISRCG